MHHTDTPQNRHQPTQMAQTCALPGMPQVPAAHPDPRHHLQPPNPQTGQHHLRLHLPQLPAQNASSTSTAKNLKKAIRLWNHHASHHQRNEQ